MVILEYNVDKKMVCYYNIVTFCESSANDGIISLQLIKKCKCRISIFIYHSENIDYSMLFIVL